MARLSAKVEHKRKTRYGNQDEICTCLHGGEEPQDHTPGIGCERRWCTCRYWPVED